jgi:membrane protease YdiL (CAAX protease family)
MDVFDKPDELETAAIIMGTLLFYYTYFYLSHSQFVERIIRNRITGGNKDLSVFFFRKTTGFFILGVVPAILYFGLLKASGEKFGLTFNHFESSFLIITGLVILTAVILFFHHKGNPERSTLQMNPPVWNVPMFMLNALGWSIYLIAYEFLFRGILLFECYETFGFWPAIAINVTLYSAIHMVSGKEQAIGTLVFGTIACYFALSMGTLLIPVFMHLSASILSNFYSIRSMQGLKIAGNTNIKNITK